MRRFTPFCLFFAFFLPFHANAQEQINLSASKEGSSKYGYYYKGKLISLSASKKLIAISEERVAFMAFVKAQGLTRNPLSERAPLKKRKLGLYSLAVPKIKTEKQIDYQALMESFVRTTQEEIQPVFEQGQALLIPSDEVIVGLKEALNLTQAKSYFQPYMKKQGILEVREHRKDSFVLRIDNPSNGRIYQVCQYLAKQDEIDFAEPNHIVVLLDEPSLPLPARGEPARGVMSKESELNSDQQGIVLPETFYTTHSSVAWTVMIKESFEGASLPTNWLTGRWSNVYTDAYWSVTNHRGHSGNRSCYATGGGTAGIAPPGGYPNDCFNWLDTPTLNLVSYEEVYIEFWFYAKYQDPNFCTVNDYGYVGIYNPSTESVTRLRYLAVCQFGDLTADATTDDGWRRVLLRVPPQLRLNGIKVRFVFLSDNSVTDEGLYIDQVRIVGTTEVDTDPLGNDTYGARLYEMKNAGQIAGLGNDDNDMHVPEAWDLVSVSPNIIVAVIDSGVDLTHPDLNLDTGYDHDGSVGGGARGSHGTAVAGNVGAVGDNSLGVMGTAPGVQIMPIYLGGTFSEYADAIDVAVANGADILSNSWGWVGTPSLDIETAIRDALNAGRVVLFAAGNGPDRSPWTYDVAFPGNLTGSTDLICVGASSPTDEHKAAASSDGAFSWGSSYIGNGPDITAPSPWSYTTDIQGAGGYNSGLLIDPLDPSSADYTPTFGGTSSATPKVAGIVALMLSANSNLTPRQVKRILRDTADDIDVPGFDDKTGAGRVNAYRAVKSLVKVRRRAWSVHAGVAQPYGNFNNIADAGFTINLDVFFPISQNLGWDLRLGFSRFNGTAGLNDIDIWNFSANLKYFLVSPGSPLEPFVNGGVGLYYIDRTELETGYNIGIGLGRDVTPNLTLELTFNFHSAVTASPDVRFGKLQFGLLWSF